VACLFLCKQGCPVGYEVAKGGVKPADKGVATTIACQACQPNTYQPSSADDSGSGFATKCSPCPDYQETKWWASGGCYGCPAGHFPKNKRAPLECTKCLPVGGSAIQAQAAGGDWGWMCTRAGLALLLAGVCWGLEQPQHAHRVLSHVSITSCNGVA
jgi:hypothetical protein